MRFDYPLFLLLLVLLPVPVVFLRRSGTGFPSRRAATALRTAALATLILALSGPGLASGDSGVKVLYVLDFSESVSPHARDRAMDAAAGMHAERGARDASALAVFGRETLLERSFSKDEDMEYPLSLVDGSGTDIETALVSLLPMFPEDGEKRIVLFTDGVETAGNALSAADWIGKAGVSVYPVLTTEGMTAEEVYIPSIQVPGTVREGDPHEIQVTISSTTETRTELLFSLDGDYLGEDSLTLQPGLNTWTYTSVAEGKGTHLYRVDIYPERDTVRENNSVFTSLEVTGKPRVLVVSPKGEIVPALRSALETQGINVDFRGPGDIPSTRAGLSRYDTVVVNNVPAFSLSYETMELLEEYTRMGGGFLMTGGPDSFGPGGYFATPIEALLPVAMDVPSHLDIPPLSLVMLIDKSGSMGGETTKGVSKLDLVKEAVMAAVDVLNPFYVVGILSFDADYEWTVPVMEAGGRSEIEKGVGTLSPGGGTRLYPALEEAFRVLADSPSAVRHIIVLSDGRTDVTDFDELMDRIAAAGITVSAVGVGKDSDGDLLEYIARRGRGRWYYTDNPEDVPSIFVTESKIVSENLIVEEPFIPLIAGPSEVLQGFRSYPLPGMEGFVLVYLKDQADLVLSASGGNPLLATWRYGLGMSAAFTSDVNGRWSADFLAWELFPGFITRLIRTLSGPATTAFPRADIRIEDELMTVFLDVIDQEEKYVNLLDIRAYVHGPGHEETPLVFSQTAPGRYKASFPAKETGLYTLTVYDGSGNSRIPVTGITRALSFSKEFLPRPPDVSGLTLLARRTGGRILDPRAGEETGIYEPSEGAAGEYTPLRQVLTLTALLLFFTDLVVRSIPRIRKKRREEAAQTSLPT